MKKIPVIMDCDPGIDDSIGILTLASKDIFDIKAITTVSGNVNADLTTYNARIIGGICGLDIKVAKGMSKPITRAVKDGAKFHGKDGMAGKSNLFDKKNILDLDELSAFERIVKLLSESKEKFGIIATAPLTNIATVLLAYPNLKEKIDFISIMGGGFNNGNVTERSEYNFYADPEAAHIVFDSGIKIILSPLDLTLNAYFTKEDMSLFKDIEFSHNIKILMDILEFYSEKQTALHDPCAVLAISTPQIMSSFDTYVQIDTSSGSSRGQSYADMRKTSDKKPNCTIYNELNRQAFMQEIVNSIKFINSKNL